MTIKVLFVDDDDKLREVIARVLNSAVGIQVTTASSLEEAREHIRKDVFNFVLLDLVLGDGTGIALVPDLRKADIPFRYFSQYTEAEAIREFGEQVEGLVLNKGPDGVRMDLVTRIRDNMRQIGAAV